MVRLTASTRASLITWSLRPRAPNEVLSRSMSRAVASPQGKSASSTQSMKSARAAQRLATMRPSSISTLLGSPRRSAPMKPIMGRCRPRLRAAVPSFISVSPIKSNCSTGDDIPRTPCAACT